MAHHDVVAEVVRRSLGRRLPPPERWWRSWSRRSWSRRSPASRRGRRSGPWPGATARMRPARRASASALLRPPRRTGLRRLPPAGCRTPTGRGHPAGVPAGRSVRGPAGLDPGRGSGGAGTGAGHRPGPRPRRPCWPSVIPMPWSSGPSTPRLRDQRPRRRRRGSDAEMLELLAPTPAAASGAGRPGGLGANAASAPRTAPAVSPTAETVRATSRTFPRESLPSHRVHPYPRPWSATRWCSRTGRWSGSSGPTLPTGGPMTTFCAVAGPSGRGPLEQPRGQPPTAGHHHRPRKCSLPSHVVRLRSTGWGGREAGASAAIRVVDASAAGWSVPCPSRPSTAIELPETWSNSLSSAPVDATGQ